MASVSSTGRVSYVDEDGNPVIIETQAPIAAPVEEGDSPSAPTTAAEDGTDSSPSSPTLGKSESSTDTGSLSPAPTTENPSAQDPTASGTASSTAGSGEASPTPATESSEQPTGVDTPSTSSTGD